MKSRSYRSSSREAAANHTRLGLIAAAGALLRAPKGFAGFSLEAIAKETGVTRATVYKHFGSRRALLEVVFDDMASRGGLQRLDSAVADENPAEALRRLISIFCDFWDFDKAVLVRLHAAGAVDRDFGVSLRERNERRRKLILALVLKINQNKKMPVKNLVDPVDAIFALTSVQMFEHLSRGKRTASATCKLIQNLAEDTMQRAGLRLC